MQPLILHADCDKGPVHKVTADIHQTAQGCDARFRLEGDIEGIKIPPHATASRRDNLWKTTCFEIFWQPLSGRSYREFNLSPSSRWACYDFDGFREGMRDGEVGAVSIDCTHSGTELVLEAKIEAELRVPAKLALNAIVEDHTGAIQFWALAFAAGAAEFHSETCRTHIMEQN
jgi:hypothetical protein